MKQSSNRQIMLFVLILYLFLALVKPVQSSSSTSSLYESVRALDNYGQAIQLKHAQAAADQQGRLIVAIKRKRSKQNDESKDDSTEEDTIWVVSVYNEQPVHQRPKKQRLLEPITFPKHATVLLNNNDVSYNKRYSSVYIVCTGIQADAAWLIDQLREYVKNVSELYDNNDNVHSISKVASFLLLRKFWKYQDIEKYYQPPGTNTMIQNIPNWGRPLGIRCLLITCCNNNKKVQLELMEPSGTITNNLSISCIGRYCQDMEMKLISELEEYMNNNSDSTSSIDDDAILEQALLKTFTEIIPNFNNGKLQVEILSPSGQVDPKELQQRNKAVKLLDKLITDIIQEELKALAAPPPPKALPPGTLPATQKARTEISKAVPADKLTVLFRKTNTPPCSY